MKRIKTIMLLTTTFGLTVFSLQGVDAKTPITKVGDLPKKQVQAVQTEEDDLIDRDEMSGSDALAIPLDESEVEDEEEINQIDKKNVFNLPKAK